jgi:integrase
VSQSQRNSRRVYGTGSLFEYRGKWYGQWRVDGRLTKKAIGSMRKPGTSDGLTRKQAEAELRRKMVESGTGARPGESVTFADAAAEYLRYVGDVRKIGEQTLSDYRGVVDGYLVPEFGDCPLDAITPDMIDAYKERLIAKGKLSDRTIVRHLTVLHGVFKRAKRAFKHSANPASADLVERPRATYSGEFDTYTPEEIELLAANAADDQDAAIYRVAAFTGLRQGELLALRWANVDFVGGLLHVRRSLGRRKTADGKWEPVEKVPKGKKVRSVPMMPAVVDTLARLKERNEHTADDDLVFIEAGQHLDHYRLRKRFYAAVGAAELRRLRFHDLRHCFGSHAITALDAYAVQSYMGHAHYSTTQRYLHHKPRPEDAARLANAFGHQPGINQGTTPNNSTQQRTGGHA